MSARLAWLSWYLLAPCSLVPAAEAMPPRLYAVTIETGLPHLEENLRYATTRATLCLGERQLASAFPVLRHEALAGCRLDRPRREGASIAFELTCSGSAGTTGSARWDLEAHRIRGTLEVKLGAKNMTFYQRLAGRAVGECRAPD